MVTDERSDPAKLSLAGRLPDWVVFFQLALWSSAVGDLLCWGDVRPSDLILHPLQSAGAIMRGIADDAGATLPFLFYGVVIVVPVWLLLSFVRSNRTRSGAGSSIEPRPTSGTTATNP
jgi:hypothetical protein